MDASGLTGITTSSTTAANAAAATASKAQTASAAASSASSSTTTSASAVYYSSPVVSHDSATHAVILEWRDTKTGAALFQSPSQAALLYAQAQEGRPSGKGPSSTGSGHSVSRLA